MTNDSKAYRHHANAMPSPAPEVIGEASGTHPQMGQATIRVVDYKAGTGTHSVELTVGGQTKTLDMTPDKAAEYLTKFRGLCGC